MNKIFPILLLISLGWVLPDFIYAQTSDFGGIGSLSLSKDLGRLWDAKLEQELRMNQDFRTLDRSLTSIGVDYTIIKKLLKASLDYNFIYQKQDEYYEIRHRSSASLEGQLSIRSFDLELRTKGQATWRDENRGDYKFNPKYVWRNKLECTYSIFGSPLKPFLSGEIFCPLNSENGFYMDGYRLMVGSKYKFSKRIAMVIFIRYDQEIQQADPQTIVYGGVGWNYKL